MNYSFVTYRTIGCIYEIGEVELTKKGFQKRWLWLEIPTTASGTQKTIIRKFLTLGDECGSLDYWEKGQWTQLMFRLDSREWSKPETGEKIHLQSEIIVDMHKMENPFEADHKVDDSPEALSPDPINELAKNVKDWKNEKSKDDVLFADKEDDNDGLPF